jgi:hypothetical protein
MIQKNRNKIINNIFLRAGCSLFRVKGFSCSLDVLYGGTGKVNCNFWSKKDNFFSCIFFLNFLVIKTLDPDWIRIGIQPKMLDPDPYQIHLKCWIRIKWIWIHNAMSPRRPQCPPHPIAIHFVYFKVWKSEPGQIKGKMHQIFNFKQRGFKIWSGSGFQKWCGFVGIRIHNIAYNSTVREQKHDPPILDRVGSTNSIQYWRIGTDLSLVSL